MHGEQNEILPLYLLDVYILVIYPLFPDIFEKVGGKSINIIAAVAIISPESSTATHSTNSLVSIFLRKNDIIHYQLMD